MTEFDHEREQFDKEEQELYRKACTEAGKPLPETYRQNGRKHWRYETLKNH